ncbi:protein star isoform X1 [Nasonia vitripennis]|uniref:Star n=2 Tax=Nasonia vitripennis TaxID=7425 RepID=A0A7M7HAB0_NASVI|nr:protein star isoform X1 [Nasonia vitripennis]
MVRLPELLLFAEDVWRKTLGKLGPNGDKHAVKSKMPSTLETPVSNATSTSEPTSTTATTTMTTAPSNNNNNSNTAAAAATKKRCWRRRTVHFTVFLAVFSTILSLLWVYTLTAELRRKAFDRNMTQNVLYHVSMDNPQLAAYIRGIHMHPTMRQEPLNASQTPEERFVASQFQSKREGVYIEYMSRVGAASTTGWLEASLDWRGVMIFTDPRNSLDAKRSSRNPKTRVLRACLSNDNDTKEITYHQEADVQVTKLGDGPNSLVFSKESLPATRLICFPLYSILLAYNTTTLDYLSLDSTEIQDGLALQQVLDTIPWNSVRISILSIYWSPHHSEAETESVVKKLSSRSYKRVKNIGTDKLVFLYNRGLKI